MIGRCRTTRLKGIRSSLVMNGELTFSTARVALFVVVACAVLLFLSPPRLESGNEPFTEARAAQATAAKPRTAALPSADHGESAGLLRPSAPQVEKTTQAPSLVVQKRIEDAPEWAVP